MLSCFLIVPTLLLHFRLIIPQIVILSVSEGSQLPSITRQK